MKSQHLLLTTLTLVLILAAGGCGSDNGRQLQSISISPASTNVPRNGSVTFTATGQFSMSPMTVTPARVSWMEFGPGLDPVITNRYSLTSQPFGATCLSGTYTVVAYAPMDPHASASGNVPSQVFQDLVVQHTMSSEGGFVAATAQLTCP